MGDRQLEFFLILLINYFFREDSNFSSHHLICFSWLQLQPNFLQNSHRFNPVVRQQNPIEKFRCLLFFPFIAPNVKVELECDFGAQFINPLRGRILHTFSVPQGPGVESVTLQQYLYAIKHWDHKSLQAYKREFKRYLSSKRSVNRLV